MVEAGVHTAGLAIDVAATIYSYSEIGAVNSLRTSYRSIHI